MLNILSFRPSYAAPVAELILSIQRGEFGMPITLDDQPDLRDIAAFYQKGNGQFWLAVDGDTVVGTIGLLDIGDGAGALRKMFVAPSHRGSGHRTAQRLLDRLVEWAGERGMAALYLGTTEQFRAAHRFYEKNGFAEIEQTALPASFPVMAVDTRFYVKSLKHAQGA